MDDDRNNLSALIDRPLRLLNAGDGRNIEIRCSSNDELLATVNLEDLFDKNGNRFENDLD